MDIDPILLIVSLLAANLIGVSTAGMFFERANKDKALKDSVEQMLYNSASKEILELVNHVARMGGEVITFVEDVTDNEPNEGE